MSTSKGSLIIGTTVGWFTGDSFRRGHVVALERDEAAGRWVLLVLEGSGGRFRRLVEVDATSVRWPDDGTLPSITAWDVLG